jgi:formylmethanofuran dehydrogenase subunit E
MPRLTTPSQAKKTSLQDLLEKSAREHQRLCPRQVLGVRLGLAGLKALGFSEPPTGKRLLIIVETDGCFVDGLSAATNCTLGHRTLRVEDYGKTAAVFVDTVTAESWRVAPAAGIRAKAVAHAREETDSYAAQLQAYQSLPDEALFTVQPVLLNQSLAQLHSRPGLRVECALCGEEIMNEREVLKDGLHLCRTCANQGYYHPKDVQ